MNQSVMKALGLLVFFTETEVDLTLSELAQRSKLPKATVFRLLSSLEHMGFLVKSKHSDQNVRYRLGLKLLELGSLVADQLELRRVAQPMMKHLQSEINETIHLVIREGDEAVYIEKVESNHALRLYTRIGRRSPLSLGSGPQLLLAFLPEAEQQRIISGMTFRKFTNNTITKKSDLLEKIQRTKEQGFSLSYGEQDEGTIGFSYPVFDRTANVIAALSVSGPDTRLSGEHMEYARRRAEEIANKISKKLGYIKETSSV